MNTDIYLKNPDERASKGYLAEPKEPSKAGIVVLQEIYGVNADIRAKADYWAGMGYQALAPDLFWRIEPGVQLNDRDEAQHAKALELYQRFDVDQGVKDVQAAITSLRERGCVVVGVLGFCMGGLLAYLAAARTDSDATVAFYGGGIDQHLDEAEKIAKPLQVHLAAEDEFIGKDAQQAIHAALDKRPNVRVFDYPYVRHAFTRDGGRNHDRCARSTAEHRVGEFFYMKLKLDHWKEIAV